MSNIAAIRRAFIAAIRAQSGERMAAFLGDADGNVAVDGRVGWVYARLEGSDVALQAYNQTVASIADSPVWIERIPAVDGVLQIISTRAVTAQSGDEAAGGVYGIPSHANTHRWMAADGGSDPVMVELRQWMPLRVTPTGGLTVKVYPGVLPDGDTWQSVPEQTLDLTSYVPAAAGQARLVLLYLTSAGIFSASAGTAKAAPTWNDIPALPDDSWSLAIVYLEYGQTEITESRTQTDLMDLRWPQPPDGANAIHDNVNNEIYAITEKPLPVGADILLIEDSADSYSKKRVQIENLPSSGAGGSWPVTITNEDHTAETDGTKTNFITANVFQSESTQVFLAGALQRPNDDYTEDASLDAVTFASAPAASDLLITYIAE